MSYWNEKSSDFIHGHYDRLNVPPYKNHSAGPDTDFIKNKGLSFMTNIDAKDDFMYRDVIREYWQRTGDTNAIFFISNYATDIHGRYLKQHNSIWTKDVDRNYFRNIWKSMYHNRDIGFIKQCEFSV